jgi:integrase
MPAARLPYLNHERTRHGRLVWVVRVGKGPRTRLRDAYGSPAFLAAYHAAIARPAASRPRKPGEGTFGWLWDLYRASPAWAELSPATKKQRENLIKPILDQAADAPLSAITRKEIIAARDSRADTPGQAGNFLKALRSLFRWALDVEHVKIDPTVNVKMPKQRGDGFHTWTSEEMARFEARWPTGTRERLAYDILVWTGLRRGDAARLGPQNVRNNVLFVKTAKTGAGVAIPILPPLARSIAATNIGATSFVVRADGEPMVKGGFGSWFAHACIEAGVPGRAHGLRKALAVKLAEAGAGPLEIGAILGNDMGAMYAKKASVAKLAAAAFERLGFSS